MKLLASDFDNTLFFYEGMREKDLNAIKAFQKQGNLFGVCTGRTLEGIQRASKDYDIQYDFYILNTGSLILDKDLNIIFEKKIPMTTAKKLQSLVGDDVHMSLVVGTDVYHIDKYDIRNYPGEKIESLDELDYIEIDSCSFHYHKGQIEETRMMINKILDQLGNEISAYQNNEHIDCTALGCSKGEGIEIVKKHFKLINKDINGIGDSFNDLPMFSHVGYSYTFDYSPVEVQKQADCIVKSIEDCINNILD